MNESQNNDNKTEQTEQTTQLADLEPSDEVKGGGSDLVKISTGEVGHSTAATQGRSLFVLSTGGIAPKENQ